MKRVLVTGGTGTLGREVVDCLKEAGYIARVMSRRTGMLEGGEWVQANLSDGSGLVAAVQDVDVIVHAASGSNLRKTDIEGTERLLTASQAADVQHLLFVSIVGIDKIPFIYYKTKLEVEQRVQAGQVPWSILRATQFHTLPHSLLKTLHRLPLFLVPTDFHVQPIDPRAVAERIVEQVGQGADGMLADIGGPEILTLGTMAQSWLAIRRSKRRVFHLPLPGAVAQGFRRGYNTTPQNRYGQLTWQQWLEEHYGDMVIS